MLLALPHAMFYVVDPGQYRYYYSYYNVPHEVERPAAQKAQAKAIKMRPVSKQCVSRFGRPYCDFVTQVEPYI